MNLFSGLLLSINVSRLVRFRRVEGLSSVNLFPLRSNETNELSPSKVFSSMLRKMLFFRLNSGNGEVRTMGMSP